MSQERDNRILKRNQIIRGKFNKLASKRCYRIDFMLQLLSDETGLHTEYLRSIVTETNKTEQRIRQQGIQTKLFDDEQTI